MHEGWQTGSCPLCYGAVSERNDSAGYTPMLTTHRCQKGYSNVGRENVHVTVGAVNERECWGEHDAVFSHV